MGLDMYLNKFPRTSYFTLEELQVIISKHKSQIRDGLPLSFSDTNFTQEQQDAARKLIENAGVSFYDWDDGHQFPQSSLQSEVGYWRKANAVHDFFVQTVQGGVDDCDYHDEVTREVLEELRDRCQRIIESTVMVNSKIRNGMHYDFESNTWQEILEDGRVVINPEVCDAELPTQSGFFFGSTDYDEYYMEDITYTYELCERLLKEIDFDNNMLFYISSW